MFKLYTSYCTLSHQMYSQVVQIPVADQDDATLPNAAIVPRLYVMTGFDHSPPSTDQWSVRGAKLLRQVSDGT